MSVFRFGDFALELGLKTYIVGILNVTPDSFSDGGLANSVDAALRRVETMLEEGADIIDVGGESTRPGFEAVPAHVEIGRVEPVITACLKRFPKIAISIDTSKPEVARAALDAGALIVNDIWGFQRDEEVAQVVAEFKAGCFLMRNGRMESSKNEERTSIEDRVSEYWKRSIAIARSAGLIHEQIALDPGIGFGTTREEELEMIRSIGSFKELGYAVLIGASRKRITGELLDLPVDERLETTLATTVAAIQGGADFVRAHDVKENVRTARMADLIYRVS